MHLFAKPYAHLDGVQTTCCCCCKSVKDPNARELSSLTFKTEEREHRSQWFRIFSNIAAPNGDVMSDEMPMKTKILVLVNPFGGNGRGPGVFQIAREILDKAAHLEIEVMQTERKNHARD